MSVESREIGEAARSDAFEESVRIKKKGRLFPGWHEIPAKSSRGILQEVQSLFQKYRSELVRQSRLLDQGGRA
jgi:hypothetical protein